MNYTINTTLSFEVHVSEHCNLNCKGCFHFSPLAPLEFIDLLEYERDLKRLSELLGGEADYINLLGGEPLLNSELVSIIRITRKYFEFAKIRVVTNGILISEMKEEFWNICEECNVVIAVSEYPIKRDLSFNREIVKKYNLDFEIHSAAIYLRRKSLDLSGGQNCEDSFKNCMFANRWIQLKHGKLYTCAPAAYFEHLNKWFNLGIYVSEQNCIDIYKAQSGDEILKKMARPIPLCRYCNVDGDVYGIKHTCSERSKYEWIDMDFRESDLEYLKDKKVLVFGAGKVGKQISEFLIDNSIEIKNILVTCMNGNEHELFGIKVIALSDIGDDSKDLPLIVAVTDKLRQEVTKLLVEHGFSNLIFIKI